jgi:FixJ family two-component response regulator
MNRMKTARTIELEVDERRQLERWSRGRSTPARLVLRARIVLLAANGAMNKNIASDLNTSRKTVSLWRTRFAEQRLAGIERDAPRPGRQPAFQRRQCSGLSA